jgi:hypothetical protein
MFNPCGHGGDTLGLCGYGPSARMHMSVRACAFILLSLTHSLTHPYALTHTPSLCVRVRLSLSLCMGRLSGVWPTIAMLLGTAIMKLLLMTLTIGLKVRRPPQVPHPMHPLACVPARVCMYVCMCVCGAPCATCAHVHKYTHVCVYVCTLSPCVRLLLSVSLCTTISLSLSLFLYSLRTAPRCYFLTGQACVCICLCLSLPGRCPLSLSLFCMYVCMYVYMWAYGAPQVPAGLFIPSLALGAAFGRAYGMVLEQVIQYANPRVCDREGHRERKRVYVRV